MPKIEPVFGVVAVIAIFLVALAVFNPATNMTGITTTTSRGTGAYSTTATNQQTSSVYGTTSGPGSFTLMMTDPPTVPSGVTDLFMTYDKVGIHVAGQSNSSGWVILTESGVIDLMQAVNISQTIATANLQNGADFNALGFNITSVVVTYDNGASTANYTADLVYGQSRFLVPISGGIVVNSSEDQSVMIDMTPKVLLLGSANNPTFAFLPNGRGLVIPNGAVSVQSHAFVGERVSLQGNHWWQSVLADTNFSVTNIALSENSLSITVQNTGANPIVFRFAAVTSQYSLYGGNMPLPAVSDIFIVQSNGTLAQLNATSNMAFEAQLQGSGYVLEPNASVTFTYSGSIALGIQSYYNIQQGKTFPIVPGDNYAIRLYGNGLVAAAGATASA